MREPRKFHVGDYVRVLDGRDIEDYAGGGFCRAMEEYIGKVTTVRRVTDDGYQLGLPGIGACYIFDGRGLELASGQDIGQEETKQPLGVTPYFVEIPVRMSQLAEAIKNCSINSYDKVEVWAMEMAGLARMKLALDEVRKGAQKRCKTATNS